MSNNNSLDILKQLKEQYDKRGVSVLVGAGFSKNAIPSYLSWDELLEDIVLFLYEKKIEEKYKTNHSNALCPCFTYESYKESAVKDYIREIGYLNLVSQYISAKGFREAIDVYIENHIPYVTKNEDWFSVTNVPKNTTFTIDNLLVHKELLNCNWKNVFTTNYDNLLELTSECQGMDYEKILTDFDLSLLSEKRGIIKVHGSLVEDSLDPKFEFDNDKTRRYIISREDYETYSEKHQAFSYLMRTSLLTGVFCLIGFSGNDPNFLGWLEWMRDILDKDVKDEDKQKTKIYLLSLDNDDVETDRKLFYKNHRISVLNIKDPVILNELGLDASAKTKSIFIQLFKYLRREIGLHEQSPSSLYVKLWGKVSKNTINNKVIDDIRSKRNSHFVTKKTWRQYQFVYNLIGRDTLSPFEAELFAIAANDCGLMPSFFPEQQKEQLDTILEWKQLQMLESAYLGETISYDFVEDKDTVLFYQILSFLYRFEFEKVKELVEDWQPTIEWTTNKAAFISLYNRNKAIDILEEYIKKTTDPQQKCFAANLANNIIPQYPPRFSYNEFQSMQVDNFGDIQYEIMNELKKKKDKKSPYGVVTKTFSLSGENHIVVQSLKFLAFLARTGCDIQFGVMVLTNADDWYIVFSSLFESYPNPCLYYSLQLTDRRILRRIGQDFAYSEVLIEQLPEILTRLLKTIDNTERGINFDSYYTICEELFVAVKEEKWFDLFFGLFEKIFVQHLNRITRLDEITSFVMAAVKVLREKQNVSLIFERLLGLIDRNNIYFVSELIYYLKLDLLETLSQESLDSIKEIVQNNGVVKSFFLIAALYDNDLVNDEFKEFVSSRIVIEKEQVIIAGNKELYSLSYFVKDNQEAQKIVRESILGRNMWNCGVDGDQASPPQYLRLNKISKGIIWAENDFEIILNNMKENIDKLEKSPFLDDPFLGAEYVSLLTDMLDFVDNIVVNKYSCTQFKVVSDRIQLLLGKVIPGGFSFDLVYDTEADITDIVKYLVRCINYYGAEKYAHYVDALINRALMKEKRYLNLVLDFVRYIACEHFGFINDPIRLHKIKLLLEMYSQIDYRELEIHLSSAYGSLWNIAQKLSEEGIEIGAIGGYWLNNPKVSRFCIDRVFQNQEKN